MTSVAIAGAGFGGIALAIALKKAGFEDFTLYERSDSLGGVWRDNAYPGAACDVPSRFYCYSFEQDYDWSSFCAPQRQILDYLNHCADKYGVAPHIRFGTEIASAAFDEGAARWTLQTRQGDRIEADMFVSAVGLFNRPRIPAVYGREDFTGDQFHSSQWPENFDPAGRSIAVIGTGASAVQIVPSIAESAGRLAVFQRTPQYVGSMGGRTGDLDGGSWLTRRIERAKLFWRFETGTRRRASERLTKKGEAAFLDHLERAVPDDALRERLTPRYPLGCKRVLRSDGWYPALQRDNVELVDTPVSRIVLDGIVTEDGRHVEADTIVWCTGFTPTDYLAPMRVTGAGGRDLNMAWREGAEAYLGLAVDGFPNFFMMYGPNTNLSGSIIFMLECQARYVADAVRNLSRKGARSMAVRAGRLRAYNEMVQRRIAKTVLVHPSCHSYFRTASGKVTTQWPGFMSEYRWRTRRVRNSDYVWA